MGEIADAMLDGTLCAGCGDYLGQDDGFPIYCDGCAPHFPSATAEVDPGGSFSCQIDGCHKRFRTKAAKKAHRKTAHGRFS